MTKNNQKSIAAATDVSPDVASSSHEYAARFAGAVGEYFLKVQNQTVEEHLINALKHIEQRQNCSILDLGGGHSQLLELYLKQGFKITIQGSEECSFQRARDLGYAENQRINFAVSALNKLNFPDNHFDFVSGIRLLAHIENWQSFLDEMLRVSKYGIIFDFANKNTINFLSPLFFNLKKKIEGNTRPYFCQSLSEIRKHLEQKEVKNLNYTGQFVLPMALHRLAKSPSLSAFVENVLAKIGLKDLLGTPVVVYIAK